jgi:hypothetical protein
MSPSAAYDDIADCYEQVRELGWTPCGVDISAAMLRYTGGRLPAVRADATRLPVRDGCVPAVLSVMVHKAYLARPCPAGRG